MPNTTIFPFSASFNPIFIVLWNSKVSEIIWSEGATSKIDSLSFSKALIHAERIAAAVFLDSG